MSLFEKQRYGAVVAAIRDGENAIEMKDNGDGTIDLTVFEDGDDITAYKLDLYEMLKLRSAVGEAIRRARKSAAQTTTVVKETTDDGTSGQDRDSYSDTQDRDSYTVED